MEMMILGLILFLGGHSVRIFAENGRTRLINRIGQNAYKGIYALVAILGIILIVKGHDNALEASTWGWAPPVFTKHIALLLMLFAVILLVSTYIPNNHIKAKLKHPMVLSVKVWALAHLISNGEAANVILFGCFLIWAVLDFRFARKRDRQVAQNDANFSADQATPKKSIASTVSCILLGAIIWVAMLAYLHNLFFGVYPIIIPGLIGPTAVPAAVVLPT